MHNKDHWGKVSFAKAPDGVSWFQPLADMSMRLVHDSGIGIGIGIGIGKDAAIIDVGDGASTLVDDLLDDGYGNLTVLVLSGAALAVNRQRLGTRSNSVRWLEADVTRAEFETHSIDL